MEKNQLIKCQGIIYRVLAVEEDSILLIDCIKKSMPKWYEIGRIEGYEDCTEEELLESTGIELVVEQDLSQKARCIAHKRFTVVAGILPFLDDDRFRVEAVKKISKEKRISKQTVRNYLCQYLTYQSISALVPKERAVPDRELTEDEKNFRWALNKFYFTRHKNSLKTAYTYMLKERYCDGDGNLLSEYPSFNQFRYFHSKYKTQQNTIISRHGLKEYQKITVLCLGMEFSHLAQMLGLE